MTAITSRAKSSSKSKIALAIPPRRPTAGGSAAAARRASTIHRPAAGAKVRCAGQAPTPPPKHGAHYSRGHYYDVVVRLDFALFAPRAPVDSPAA
jgi:hypothetical protein